jgi:hypothetical protein
MKDPQIISAIIQGIAMILAALITVVGAWIFGRIVIKTQQLKDERDTAIKDIRFLYEVETLHCEKHKEDSGVSYRNKIRELVRGQNAGWELSGRFTASKVKDAI